MVLQGASTSLLEKQKYFHCRFAICHVATFAERREGGQSLAGRRVLLGHPLDFLQWLLISDVGDVITNVAEAPGLFRSIAFSVGQELPV